MIRSEDKTGYPHRVRRFVSLMSGTAAEPSPHAVAIEKMAECLTPLERNTLAVICARLGVSEVDLLRALEDMDVVISFRVMRDSFIATGERLERERQAGLDARSPPSFHGETLR